MGQCEQVNQMLCASGSRPCRGNLAFQPWLNIALHHWTFSPDV
jgi:hypothetical protein